MKKYQSKMELLGAHNVAHEEYGIEVEKDIAKIEEEIGCSLPRDYIDFLSNFGGFSVNARCCIKKVFPGHFYVVGEELALGVFFAAHSEDSCSCYRVIVKYEIFKYRIPSNLLPIAGDELGNLFCLAIKGDDSGCVYFWDREEEEEVDEEAGEEPGYSNVYLLANSFDEFMNSLEKDPDYFDEPS